LCFLILIVIALSLTDGACGAFPARVLQAGDPNPNLNSLFRLVCDKAKLIFGAFVHGGGQKSAKNLRLRSLRKICYFNGLSPTDPLLFAGLVRAKR
jgi:hypothetical protein